jgi:hypothetical protein
MSDCLSDLVEGLLERSWMAQTSPMSTTSYCSRSRRPAPSSAWSRGGALELCEPPTREPKQPELLSEVRGTPDALRAESGPAAVNGTGVRRRAEDPRMALKQVAMIDIRSGPLHGTIAAQPR